MSDWTKYWAERAALDDEYAANGYGLSPLEYREHVLDPYLDLLELKPHHSALDVGCGTGLFLAELEKRVATAVGTDASEEMLSRYRGPAEIVVGPADALPFPDSSFDRVSMIYVAPSLPSVPYFEQAVREMFRLLRGDGILLVAGILVNRSSSHVPFLCVPRRRLVRLAEELGCHFSLLAPDPLLRDSRVHERCELVVYKGSPAASPRTPWSRLRLGRG